MNHPAHSPAQFRPSQRLSTAAQYQQVFARARRSSDPLFTLLARANSAGIPRLGLAISKRAVRRAVARNRLKRLARETFRLHAGQVAIDYVVMAKPAANAASNAAIRQSLDRHFTRLEAVD